MRSYFLFPAVLLLSGCITTGLETSEPARPDNWTMPLADSAELTSAEKLKAWWTQFNDPTLNELVAIALVDSPDRNIAQARIQEARGIRRSSRSSLFPQIGLSAEGGRQDTGDGPSSYTDNFYDAGFDASFELDIFGVNRNAYSAADNQVDAAEAAYHNVSLTLIADIVRSYIDFRAAENQYRIADKNLKSQEQTLTLTQDRYELGEAPLLDVERSKNLVDNTRASLPEFNRLRENAKLRLSVLTGKLPQELSPVLTNAGDIPGAGIAPILMSPAEVLSLRPDVKAAKATLLANTDLAESATAELFPSFNLGGFYGISDNALMSSATVWNVVLGAAVSLLDFGRIEGRIDAARAREVQAFEEYRKTIIAAVVEVETALNDYAQIEARRVSLEQAYQSANKALNLSQTLYREGEVSFLDVLDAQRNANNAESATVSVRAAQAESLSRLFKSLGVY